MTILRLIRRAFAAKRIFRIAAAILLVEVLGLAAWWAYDAWRVGRVVLTNDGPPLTVEVLGESGDEPIGGPVELIRRATLVLPPGDYRLRIAGEGRISRVYRFAVNRGESFTQSLTLDDNRLLGEAAIQAGGLRDPPRNDPIPFTPATAALELTPGKADLVGWSNGKLCRRDGATGQVIWDVLAPAEPGKPARRYHPWVLWFKRNGFGVVPPLDPAPDLDGDGTRDVVWAAWGGFLALSGKDGSVLWTYLAELDGPGGAYPEGPEPPGPIRPATRPAQLVGRPAMADLDRDGVADLVATIGFSEFPAEVVRRRPDVDLDSGNSYNAQLSRRVVVAVSGRSGRRLWSHAVEPEFATLPNFGWRRPAVVVPGRPPSTVAIEDGSRWIGLDPATGRPRSAPIELGFEPAGPIQHADLDGDGLPEILALGPGPGGEPQSLVAVSMTTGRPLWTAAVGARYTHPFDDESLNPDWPMVGDLDGDGRAEIVVPDSGALDPNNNYRGVCLLDGPTGRRRWARPMRPETGATRDGIMDIVDAPDLDRDGVRDVLATSLFIGRQPVNSNEVGPGELNRAYVDAISGKDGRVLWYWHVERPKDRHTYMTPPKWWGRGPDGWPLLAIPIEVEHPVLLGGGQAPSDTNRPTVYMLEASTGRLVQTLPSFIRTEVADLDGDGLLDLWGDYRGDLRAFRGEAAEAWRALGRFQPARHFYIYDSQPLGPAADLDGDGIGDTLLRSLTAPGESTSQATGSRTAMARSGRDGRLLWKADLGLRRGWFEWDRGESYSVRALPMPGGDLDGDGTADVIVQESAYTLPPQALRRPATLPLTLLSGRTGRLLWVAGPLPLGFEAHGHSSIHWVEARVVEPGTAPDLLVRHDSAFLQPGRTPPAPNAPRRPHLARISGRTGRILRDVPLTDPASDDRVGYRPPLSFEDLDGDDRPDALIFVPSALAEPNTGVELVAVSLHDGRRLWSQFFEAPPGAAPDARIFDTGDPRRPAIAVLSSFFEPGKQTVTVRALDGRDGKPLWTWRADPDANITFDSWAVASRLAGNANRRLSICYERPGGKWRLVVLDADGREGPHRDWAGEEVPGDVSREVKRSIILADDLDGDGGDELLVWHDERVHAFGRDLEERWSWPEKEGRLTFVPASGGRPAAVMLRSGLGLDGRTGRPIWLAPREQGWQGSAELLDPGDSGRRPLVLANAAGMTICRSALATTPAGAPTPPVGDPVPPGRGDDDPRWTRPLPWTGPILYTIGPKGFLAFVGLAMANVAVPLGLLRLAARRRPWTLRLLMALPLAAAVPLTVFQTIEPLIPGEVGGQQVSTRVVFVMCTLAGVPLVFLAAMAVRGLIRRRWRSLAGMAVLTVAASAIIAAAWLWIDSRSMPAIEQYSRSDWYLAAGPGAYVAGVAILVAWAMRGISRAIWRPGARRSARPVDAVPASSTMEPDPAPTPRDRGSR